MEVRVTKQIKTIQTFLFVSLVSFLGRQSRLDRHVEQKILKVDRSQAAYKPSGRPETRRDEGSSQEGAGETTPADGSRSSNTAKQLTLAPWRSTGHGLRGRRESSSPPHPGAEPSRLGGAPWRRRSQSEDTGSSHPTQMLPTAFPKEDGVAATSSGVQWRLRKTNVHEATTPEKKSAPKVALKSVPKYKAAGQEVSPAKADEVPWKIGADILKSRSAGHRTSRAENVPHDDTVIASELKAEVPWKAGAQILLKKTHPFRDGSPTKQLHAEPAADAPWKAGAQMLLKKTPTRESSPARADESTETRKEIPWKAGVDMLKRPSSRQMSFKTPTRENSPARPTVSDSISEPVPWKAGPDMLKKPSDVTETSSSIMVAEQVPWRAGPQILSKRNPMREPSPKMPPSRQSSFVDSVAEPSNAQTVPWRAGSKMLRRPSLSRDTSPSSALTVDADVPWKSTRGILKKTPTREAPTASSKETLPVVHLKPVGALDATPAPKKTTPDNQVAWKSGKNMLRSRTVTPERQDQRNSSLSVDQSSTSRSETKTLQSEEVLFEEASYDSETIREAPAPGIDSTSPSPLMQTVTVQLNKSREGKKIDSSVSTDETEFNQTEHVTLKLKTAAKDIQLKEDVVDTTLPETWLKNPTKVQVPHDAVELKTVDKDGPFDAVPDHTEPAPIQLKKPAKNLSDHPNKVQVKDEVEGDSSAHTESVSIQLKKPIAPSDRPIPKKAPLTQEALENTRALTEPTAFQIKKSLKREKSSVTEPEKSDDLLVTPSLREVSFVDDITEPSQVQIESATTRLKITPTELPNKQQQEAKEKQVRDKAADLASTHSEFVATQMEKPTRSSLKDSDSDNASTHIETALLNLKKIPSQVQEIQKTELKRIDSVINKDTPDANKKETLDVKLKKPPSKAEVKQLKAIPKVIETVAIEIKDQRISDETVQLSKPLPVVEESKLPVSLKDSIPPWRKRPVAIDTEVIKEQSESEKPLVSKKTTPQYQTEILKVTPLETEQQVKEKPTDTPSNQDITKKNIPESRDSKREVVVLKPVKDKPKPVEKTPNEGIQLKPILKKPLDRQAHVPTETANSVVTAPLDSSAELETRTEHVTKTTTSNNGESAREKVVLKPVMDKQKPMEKAPAEEVNLKPVPTNPLETPVELKLSMASVLPLEQDLTKMSIPKRENPEQEAIASKSIQDKSTPVGEVRTEPIKLKPASKKTADHLDNFPVEPIEAVQSIPGQVPEELETSKVLPLKKNITKKVIPKSEESKQEVVILKPIKDKPKPVEKTQMEKVQLKPVFKSPLDQLDTVAPVELVRDKSRPVEKITIEEVKMMPTSPKILIELDNVSMEPVKTTATAPFESPVELEIETTIDLPSKQNTTEIMIPKNEDSKRKIVVLKPIEEKRSQVDKVHTEKVQLESVEPVITSVQVPTESPMNQETSKTIKLQPKQNVTKKILPKKEDSTREVVALRPVKDNPRPVEKISTEEVNLKRDGVLRDSEIAAPIEAPVDLGTSSSIDLPAENISPDTSSILEPVETTKIIRVRKKPAKPMVKEIHLHKPLSESTKGTGIPELDNVPDAEKQQETQVEKAMVQLKSMKKILLTEENKKEANPVLDQIKESESQPKTGVLSEKATEQKLLAPEIQPVVPQTEIVSLKADESGGLQPEVKKPLKKDEATNKTEDVPMVLSKKTPQKPTKKETPEPVAQPVVPKTIAPQSDEKIRPISVHSSDSELETQRVLKKERAMSKTEDVPVVLLKRTPQKPPKEQLEPSGVKLKPIPIRQKLEGNDSLERGVYQKSTVVLAEIESQVTDILSKPTAPAKEEPKPLAPQSGAMETSNTQSASLEEDSKTQAESTETVNLRFPLVKAAKPATKVGTKTEKKTATLTTVPRCVAPTFKKKLQPLMSRPGKLVRLNCQFDGQPTPSVSWYKNEVLIQPSSRVRINTENGLSVVEISNVSVDDGGLYTCRLLNEAGSAATTASIIVTGELKFDFSTQDTLVH